MDSRRDTIPCVVYYQDICDSCLFLFLISDQHLYGSKFEQLITIVHAIKMYHMRGSSKATVDNVYKKNLTF